MSLSNIYESLYALSTILFSLLLIFMLLLIEVSISDILFNLFDEFKSIWDKTSILLLDLSSISVASLFDIILFSFPFLELIFFYILDSMICIFNLDLSIIAS